MRVDMRRYELVKLVEGRAGEIPSGITKSMRHMVEYYTRQLEVHLAKHDACLEAISMLKQWEEEHDGVL